MLLSITYAAIFWVMTLTPVTSAQSSAWGQCGGIGWTGATTCVSGYICNLVNQYYSQCIPGSAPTSSTAPTSSIPSPQPTGSSLAAIGKSIGWKYVGSATDGPGGDCVDPTYASVYLQQFNMATTGLSLNWTATEPSRGSFTFTIADKLVQWAQENSIMLRGQPLVWYGAVPSWLSGGGFDKSTLTSIINTHVANVVGRYKGQFYAWDVVDEVFNDDGTLRKSVFSSRLGESFLDIAFRAARSADPSAKLYINEDNIEVPNTKSDALYNLVKKLQSSGTPIDGIGIQGHFVVGKVDGSALQRNLAQFSNLGNVAITELDVRIPSPPSQGDLLQQQKDYQAVFAACKQVSACVGVTMWGLTDKYSWIPSTFPGYGSALPWDDNYKQKPAFSGAVDGMRS